MKPLLTPEEVAGLLRVKKQTLAEWRMKGKGPPFLKFDRAVRYDPDAVQEFLESSRSANP